MGPSRDGRLLEGKGMRAWNLDPQHKQRWDCKYKPNGLPSQNMLTW